MIKKHYQKELFLSKPQARGSATSSKDVEKIQSWLNLWDSVVIPRAGLAVEIDGKFGPATEIAVANFQRIHGMQPTGIVDSDLFVKLTEPLREAFSEETVHGSIRANIVHSAHLHLNQNPLELTIRGMTNMGPWVRSYMDGSEGNNWLWCMGFVQTIIDQAASRMSIDFRKLMPLAYSCDVVGKHGIDKNCLIRNKSLKQNKGIVQPGDIFLMCKSQFDWFHTGIIVDISDQTITTIEGNTNLGGSRNGNGVYKRIRNFHTTQIDVFSVESLDR
jgi:hypothetical protein